jgi:Putative transmembrane protein (PGPGW)
VKSAVKRFAVGALGFVVVGLGIVLMPLPGPGLLIVLVGVLILATQFEWAERRVEQVKRAALRGATDSVKSWPRILLSVVGVIWLLGFGVLWIVDPAAPAWWPVDDKWWLYGGWGPGVTLIFSGTVAGAGLVYSYLNFREIEEEQHAEAATLD